MLTKYNFLYNYYIIFMYKELFLECYRAQACLCNCICINNASRWMSTRIHAHTVA